MSDHPSGHGLFEELAAGYALDALDPQDEADFAAHLPGDSCDGIHHYSPKSSASSRDRHLTTALRYDTFRIVSSKNLEFLA